jgi:VanZ family protein
VALWFVAIWSFSGEAFSANSTSRFLGPLLRWLFSEISAAELRSFHFAVRKGAHVFEYAVLSLLAYRALRFSLDTAPWSLSALALTLVLAVASADELRQSQIAVRTGSYGDVALNLVGGILGVCLIIGFYRAHGRTSGKDG